MSYLPFHIEKKALKKRIPVDVTMELTHRCNSDCRICYISPGEKELRTAEVKNIIDKIAEEGCLFLTITGGEPFLRSDLFEILDYSTQKRFAVTLKTNGTLLDKNHAKELKAFGLQEVNISLLGSTADIHDSITRRTGSFEKAISAIRLLKEQSIRTTVMSVITKGNAGETRKIEKLAKALKADDYTFTSYIFPKNNGDISPLKYRMPDAELKKYIRILRDKSMAVDTCPLSHLDEEEKKDDIYYSCGAGRNGFLIGPSGKVFPCASLLIEIGDMKKETIRDIINSKRNDVVLEMLRLKNNKTCVNCDYQIGCFRCPGLAFLENGSAASAPLEACRHTQIIEEEKKRLMSSGRVAASY